jgi:hypothetical protein
MGTANVTGSLPAVKADGTTPATPSDCSGINIYRAAGTGSPVKVGAAVITGSSFAFQDPGLAPGSYEYGATALNVDGAESAMSPLFPAVVPATDQLLGPPTIVNVAIS